MQTNLLEIFRPCASLIAGGLIGYTFGYIQKLALQRNQKRQQSGKLDNGWMVMPGSMTRVGYLLIALLLVQLGCPLLFVDGFQWWVSGGVVLGYGTMLYRQLRERQAQTQKV